MSSGLTQTLSFGLAGMQALSPHPPRSDRRERSRVGIQRRLRLFPYASAGLLLLWSEKVVRCSPRLRQCSGVVRKSVIFVITKDDIFRTTTRSAHSRLLSSVHSVGVGHSKSPVKGNRRRSLEPLCPPWMQVPTQKQEAPTSPSEGRVGPSAVDRGSSPAYFATVWRFNTGE